VGIAIRNNDGCWFTESPEWPIGDSKRRDGTALWHLRGSPELIRGKCTRIYVTMCTCSGRPQIWQKGKLWWPIGNFSTLVRNFIAWRCNFRSTVGNYTAMVGNIEASLGNFIAVVYVIVSGKITLVRYECEVTHNTFLVRYECQTNKVLLWVKWRSQCWCIRNCIREDNASPFLGSELIF
jgi:hypothetical protein